MSKIFNFEVINNIRILSLKEAVENNFETWYLSICRWYSRNFYTPLSKVEEMAPETVLKAYYDDIYYKLATSSDEESKKMLNEEIKSLVYQKTKTSEDVEAERTEEQADEEWYQEELRKINESMVTKDKTKKSNPNLIDTEKDKEFVEFEDVPPDFEDEE